MAFFATFSLQLHLLNASVVTSRYQVRAQSLDNSDYTVLSPDSVSINGNSFIKEKERSEILKVGRDGEEKSKNAAVIDVGNGRLKRRVEKKWEKDSISKNLEVMWDDGYGTKTVRDYFDEAKMMISPDKGPPRWFCPVECGEPLKDSPVLLFLPGLDGVGLGLILHHKSLGKVFEVRCLHIPVYDRTPFEDLLKFVEETVRLEHESSPSKPIYLVGDSFGGCLALAVAACNPEIDFVTILVNPATSFDRSHLQPLLPFLEVLPDEVYKLAPYFFSSVMSDPVKVAMADNDNKLPPRIRIEQFFANVVSILPSLSTLAEIVPKETLLWKLKLLKSAAAYANSRLHAVKAEVLLIASGKDNILPSGDEAQRLNNILPNCTVRCFRENGHTFLLEGGLSLLTIIKATLKYRRSRRIDHVLDRIPVSMSEFRTSFQEVFGPWCFFVGAASFSTLDDGKIVEGLAGVPNEGPVIYVGYHMQMGLEVCSLAEEIIREKKAFVRGISHPELFSRRYETGSSEFSILDWIRLFGATPVTASNLFKMLSAKSHVILYPGGSREALHFKGEAYKLFWPDQPELVRMAAKFGATIVPFGTVGEDDIAQLAVDHNDLMKIPILNDFIKKLLQTQTRIRDESKGEVANQEIFPPLLLPKLPGRFYFLFGKPIKTAGREDLLQGREKADELYLQIKSEVERNIAYLLKKREEDPYRNVIDRILYCALHNPVHEIPSFRP